MVGGEIILGCFCKTNAAGDSKAKKWVAFVKYRSKVRDRLWDLSGIALTCVNDTRQRAHLDSTIVAPPQLSTRQAATSSGIGISDSDRKS